MIDFRYHLVSLVSVFIALAVGVVLGAGPLRGEIGRSLNASVEQLREEKNQLRTELTAAQAGVANRDTFTRELAPDLVADRLTGDRVALVLLPGVDGSAIDALVQTLRAAGATLTSQVELDVAWTEPEAEDVRGSARERLTPLLTPLALPADLDAGLTRALLTATRLPEAAAPGPSGQREPDGAAVDPVSVRILEVLDDEGLLRVRQELTDRADQVVVLAPAVEAAQTGVQLPSTPAALTMTPSGTRSGSPSAATPSSAPGAAPTEVRAADLTGWAALVGQLDRAGSGSVVAGPASSATEGGVIAAVRDASELADEVSTVDTYGTPMGDVVVALALQEQLGGGAGAYGFGAKANAALPARVTAVSGP